MARCLQDPPKSGRKASFSRRIFPVSIAGIDRRRHWPTKDGDDIRPRLTWRKLVGICLVSVLATAILCCIRDSVPRPRFRLFPGNHRDTRGLRVAIYDASGADDGGSCIAHQLDWRLPSRLICILLSGLFAALVFSATSYCRTRGHTLRLYKDTFARGSRQLLDSVWSGGFEPTVSLVQDSRGKLEDLGR